MRTLRAALLVLAAGAAGGCTTLPAPSHPRPALPLPPELVAPYALAGDVRELRLVPVGADHQVHYYRGVVACGGDQAEFTLIRPEGEHSAFVLLLPILAGGENLMWFLGADLAARGYTVAWTRRRMPLLRPPQHADDLETLFRTTVRHNRMVLEWALQQPSIDPARVGCIGISLGGIVASVLAAVEPRIQAAAICLAGGDLPSLVLETGEGRVVGWRDWRLRGEGVSEHELERELARELWSDPARFAAYLPTEKVLLVNARFDHAIPTRNQELLWEALGRPEWLRVPLGHYSTALVLGHVLGRVDTFFAARLPRRDQVATTPPPALAGEN